MNIFYLHPNPKVCAEMHPDKHCIKMIVEYAQLLSTAHRVLDGTLSTTRSDSGRKRQTYTLSDDRDAVLYSATHINHPSAIWVRQSDKNYDWLFSLYQALMDEYTYRYGKVHATSRLEPFLGRTPKNIPQVDFTEPTPAMPGDVQVKGDSIQSYKNYYIKYKQHLASWSGKINSRPTPDWFHTKLI